MTWDGAHGCAVCRSPEREAIEDALTHGATLVEVSRRFTIKRWALWYHQEGHNEGRQLRCRLTPFLAMKLRRLAQVSGHTPSVVVRILLLQATDDQLSRPMPTKESTPPSSEEQRLWELREWWKDL
jgi:hypothetical protein